MHFFELIFLKVCIRFNKISEPGLRLWERSREERHYKKKTKSNPLNKGATAPWGARTAGEAWCHGAALTGGSRNIAGSNRRAQASRGNLLESSRIRCKYRVDNTWTPYSVYLRPKNHQRQSFLLRRVPVAHEETEEKFIYSRSDRSLVIPAIFLLWGNGFFDNLLKAKKVKWYYPPRWRAAVGVLWFDAFLLNSLNSILLL